MLLRLEKVGRDPAAVRYLRSQVYVRATLWDRTADRAELLRMARTTLARLASEGRALYHRKALASLAALEFAERNYSLARDYFTRYVESYSRSDWAWVAALRIGQCDESLRNWKRAEQSYQTAAVKYASVPIARVLGHEYAAGALEALGDFAGALRQHQRALDSWDDDYGAAYSSYETFPDRIEAITGIGKQGEIAKSYLAIRIDQLNRSFAAPGGILLERGRWLVHHGRQRESLVPLEQLVAQHSTSTLVADARELLHRARLEIALTKDPVSAMADLDVLAREPLDFPVLAARLSHAALRWTSGAEVEAEAESTVLTALRDWQVHRRQPQPRPGLEMDVAEIRSALVRPDTRAGRPAFYIVNPAIAVKLADDGIHRIAIVQTFPNRPDVLFFSAEEMELLVRVAARFGETTRPNFVHPWLERPRAMWDKVFALRPGDGPAWMAQISPAVRKIEFLDTNRTKAIVSTLDSPSGGAAVVVQKRAGKWIMTETLYTWR